MADKRLEEKYWELIEGRPGVYTKSRESVKNSIIYYDVKRVQGYKGDAWQRMCQYKLAGDNFDCDVSYLAMLQYVIAFRHVGDYEISNQYRRIKFELVNPKNNTLFHYRGDTMNSYATTVHAYLNIAAEKHKVNWEICMLEPHQCLNAIIPEEAEWFIRMNHTIGNFVPIPFVRSGKGYGKEFNRPRGGGSTKDYWDLALLAIYRWYVDHNAEDLEKMLGQNKKCIELCIEWLDSFKDWHDFVKKNYMEPFVGENYGMPKELWKDHFQNYQKESHALPCRQEQFSEFFINASNWILARGELIAEAILLKLEATPGCHPWKEDT